MMSVNQPKLTSERSRMEPDRRSSSSSLRRRGGGAGGNQSYGRGGAGNMTAIHDSPTLNASGFVTPTLKTDLFTTGRGGSGNMAKNVDPISTRKAQDVEEDPTERRFSISSGYSATHVGRGGAANIFRPASSNDAADDADDFRRHHHHDGHVKAGLASSTTSGTRAGESAVADTDDEDEDEASGHLGGPPGAAPAADSSAGAGGLDACPAYPSATPPRPSSFSEREMEEQLKRRRRREAEKGLADRGKEWLMGKMGRA